MKFNIIKHFNYILLCAVILVGTSCTKWLERTDVDPSNLSPELITLPLIMLKRL